MTFVWRDWGTSQKNIWIVGLWAKILTQTLPDLKITAIFWPSCLLFSKLYSKVIKTYCCVWMSKLASHSDDGSVIVFDNEYKWRPGWPGIFTHSGFQFIDPVYWSGHLFRGFLNSFYPFGLYFYICFTSILEFGQSICVLYLFCPCIHLKNVNFFLFVSFSWVV
jgi:hypothetical protein